jgi:hypothetical protein
MFVTRGAGTSGRSITTPEKRIFRGMPTTRMLARRPSRKTTLFVKPLISRHRSFTPTRRVRHLLCEPCHRAQAQRGFVSSKCDLIRLSVQFCPLFPISGCVSTSFDQCLRPTRYSPRISSGIRPSREKRCSTPRLIKLCLLDHGELPRSRGSVSRTESCSTRGPDPRRDLRHRRRINGFMRVSL